MFQSFIEDEEVSVSPKNFHSFTEKADFRRSRSFRVSLTNSTTSQDRKQTHKGDNYRKQSSGHDRGNLGCRGSRVGDSLPRTSQGRRHTSGWPRCRCRGCCTRCRHPDSRAGRSAGPTTRCSDRKGQRTRTCCCRTPRYRYTPSDTRQQKSHALGVLGNWTQLNALEK